MGQSDKLLSLYGDITGPGQLSWGFDTSPTALTAAEKDAITAKMRPYTPNWERAAEVKRLLLAGLSVRQIVAAYKDKRGYGKTTVANISAALNSIQLIGVPHGTHTIDI